MSEQRRLGLNRYQQTVNDTEERFLRYVVTQEDAIKSGGLTEDEVKKLVEEV